MIMTKGGVFALCKSSSITFYKPKLLSVTNLMEGLAGGQVSNSFLSVAASTDELNTLHLAECCRIPKQIEEKKLSDVAVPVIANFFLQSM